MQFSSFNPHAMKMQKSFEFNSSKELSEYLLGSLGQNLQQAIKATIELLLKAEMSKLRVELEEKTAEREKLYFNGYYPRHLLSPAGRVEGISVPRFRGGNSATELQGLELFETEKQRFYELIFEMHQRGVSQQKIRELCDEYFGKAVSKKQIGKVYTELCEREEFQINEQALDDDFEYLFIDGIWNKVFTFRLDGDTNKMVMLCVLGVRRDGSRKMLGFELAKGEDCESWTRVLSSVKQRGLLGKKLKLIVSDGAEGGLKALSEIYPNTKLQLCLSHKARNVLTKCPWKHKAAMAEDLKRIYAAKNFAEALEHCKSFERKWFVEAEKSVSSLKHRFKEHFTYFEFPENFWKVIRTTNLLEREFREVRRRTKVYDNYFKSPKSAEKYHNGIFTYLNHHYPLKNSLAPFFNQQITH